jgi:hypothetical protein
VAIGVLGAMSHESVAGSVGWENLVLKREEAVNRRGKAVHQETLLVARVLGL